MTRPRFSAEAWTEAFYAAHAKLYRAKRRDLFRVCDIDHPEDGEKYCIFANVNGEPVGVALLVDVPAFAVKAVNDGLTPDQAAAKADRIADEMLARAISDKLMTAN